MNWRRAMPAAVMGVALVFLIIFYGVRSLRPDHPESSRKTESPSREESKRPGRALVPAKSIPTPTPKQRLTEWRRDFRPSPSPVKADLPSEHRIELETRTVDTSGGPGPLPTSGQQPTARGTFPWIVQFDGPVLEEWKESVARAGGVLRGYLPNYAFVVEMDELAAGRVAALPNVRWMDEYRPEYKIQPFLEHLASQPEGLEAPLSITVQTFAPEDASEVARALTAAGADVKSVSPGRRWGLVRASVHLTRDVLDALARLGSVQWIEEYVPPAWHNDFAVRGNHLNVTNVWSARGLTGRKQIIGHADTGLDTGSVTNLHPDLSGRLKAVYALGRPGDWSDTHGHGTHTAGSILGDGSASTGQFRGVAYEASLVHQSVMDAGGGLGGIPDALGDLFLQAYTNGARIHSDSWGSPVYGQYTSDSQAADEFMWDYPDMLLVFSAGNDGTDANRNGVVDPDSMGAPGTAKNMLTVGAAENDRAAGSGGYSSFTWGYGWPGDYAVNPIRDDYISESADGVHQGIAAFSSRGPTDDGRLKPDIVGPGTDVISCRSHAPGAESGWGDHPNPDYAFSGGTSMSTPLMAGAAALVRQYFLERRGWFQPSAALVKATLLNGARSLTPGQYGTNAFREVPGWPRPNNVEGWGQADLEPTLFPAPPASLLFHDVLALATGGTNLYRLFLSTNGTARFTLGWTDYPGTAGSGKKLVNDLDLLVLSPSGTNFFPNGRASTDRTNNIEGVDFRPPVSGVYTARVSGFNVPSGPQNFALVFSGPWSPVEHAALPPATNTTGFYNLDFTVTALNLPAEETMTVYWNTNGSARFATATVARVSETLCRAQIPGQPSGTTIYYYFQGWVEGAARRHPTNAPAALHSLQIADPVTLQIAGAPAAYGSPVPAYGTHGFSPSTMVTSSVNAFTAPVGLLRQACTGWTGSGSAPIAGVSNRVSFKITVNSTVTWRWTGQYGLRQTSSVPGLLNSTNWWFAGATAQTLQASAAMTLGVTNYRFAQWLLDGARQPDASSRAVNPVEAIVMSTSRTATAVYLPESQDGDTNGLPDWWELFFFGGTGQDAGADPDVDTYPNSQELADQTDPSDPSSVPSAPAITHTPLANPQARPAPWPVAAVVTDNCQVAAVTLWWQRNADAWQSAAMSTSAVPNQYTNAIPAPGVNGDTFNYYLTAGDAAGLVNTGAVCNFSVEYALMRPAPTNLGNVWMFSNSQTSMNVSVSNAGAAVLAWNAQVSTGGVGWLTLAPTNGGLSPGSVTGVAVTINSAGFTAGVSRTGQVIFRGNDPVTPTSAVPVTLRVGAAPVIAHTPPGNTTNTADPYPLDATLTPTALVNTNAAFVYWSTNDGLEFATAQLVRVSGDLFRANVPAQPAPTRVSYSLQAAATNGLIARLPTNAPAALFSFEVTLPVSLVITGTPPVAEVVPPYGESAVASGYVCQAYAKSDVPADGGRYVCTGWLGSGSAPVSGGGTSVTFTVREPTVLDWQWRREWALTQTSAPAGLLATTTWWTADSTGQTVVATESLTQDATNYRFAGWRLDGQRQPAETGRVVNPVPAILMSTSRVAVASYLPEDEDEDADGLPDWWELFYFGDTGQDSGYDADGDSFTNGQELADRTDPSDPLSTPGAPVIQHTSLADPQTAPAPWPVSAVATDNYAIAAVTLWWEINGGGWNSSAMTRVEPTDLYTNAIPAPGVQGDHVEYFIEATDPAGWGTTNGPYTFEVAYPVFVVTPTNLELNWLMPGEEWPLALALTNSGNAATSWRLDTQMAGLEDDVESGAGGWTHTDAGDLWRITTNRSISPDHAWYSGHFGTPGYDDNMDCRLVSPTLWIVQGARLRFGYWIQTEVDAGDPPYAYDGGLVEISTNDGASFQSIEPVGGYPAVARGLYGSPFEPNTPFFAGTGGWQSAEFDLSAYAGREVRLAFRFGSDESFAEGEGWYVDDIVLTPAGGTDQWFTASATDGVVNADSGAGVTVDLDAQDLSAGESRGAILTFTSDDPVRPAVHIPLSLFVGPPVTLAHTPLLNTTNTVDAYAVRVTAEPLGPMPEGEPRLRLLWNSVSPFGPFETNTLVYDADNVWTGAIPAHPLGARLYYFLHAEAGAAYAFHPAGAPAVVHSFDVTGPAELVVEGFITTYGSPTPPYGTITLAAGTPVNAEAPDELYGGTWRTCTGWVGTGSVPAIGGTNRVSFVIETNSLLRWQWLSQVRMTETSMPAGIIQTVRWWKVATYASTVEAEAQVPWDGTTYRFAEWRLNGARQPPTGRATFSVTGIVMYAPQSAAALYLPEAQDADDDGLADWWEYFEFGTMATDPGADPDVDGFTNYEEFMEETDPHDPASKPAPPVIQHTPLADPQTGAAPWEVAAVVTDNFALARVPLAGQALRFDGEDDYVMRNPVTRFPSNEITVEFWMLSSDRTDRGTPFSYAMSGTFDDANEFTLFNYNTFLIYRGATYVDTDVAATDGAWHHIAVTWRSADGQARLFKDGVEAWSGALAAGQDIRPGGVLVFGQDQDSLGGGFSAQDAFDGLLDEMRVWSVIRTPEQIAAQMTNRLTGAESGLVGYWRFDEGSGAIAGDSSGGGMAGTVSGAVWTNSTAFSGGDVRLHWSRDGGTWQESIMSAGPSNRFVEWIPAPGRHGETYSYRLEARDMAGLIATNGPHEFGVELPLLDVTPSYADYWIRPATSQVESLVVSNAGVGDLAWTVAVEPMGFSDDVESGTNGWTHAGNNEAWHITMQRAASGSRSWYQGDESTGTYVDYMDASLVMPAIVLPPGASLSFRHWADTELRNSWIAWDGGIVEISTNGGMNYAQLTPEGGYPFIINGEWGSPFSSGIGCFAGAGGWTQAVFNLSAFGGQQVLLRFRFGSDQQNDYPPEGWFIDDVVITPSSGTNGWLTLALTNGALAGGAAVDLEPAFSSAGLAIGDVRAALLRFESNDPSALTNRQVVMMTVSEPPMIQHSPLQNTLETNIPYGVEAVITSPVRLDTNALFLAWHTEGAGATGATTLLARVTNDLFAGAIPAQPGGTVVNYFCSAAEGAGLVSRHPEVGWHSFLVAEQPVFLTVTGTPSEAGVPTPAYGVHPMASGVVVSASAEPGVPAGGSRLACQGWTGTGSVPAAGGTNTVSFTLAEDSTLTWQWSVQYALAQTSMPAGAVNTTTWWFAGSDASTVAAPLQIMLGGTNFHLAGWTVDGARWPDATSATLNPAQDIPMNAARGAVAVYWRADLDADGDSLPDWWEQFYFGSLAPWRTDDPDADGFTNLQELNDNSNPRDPASVPVPPDIAHAPLSDPQGALAPWPVSATITDNTAVAQATLWWQRNGGAWESVGMTSPPLSALYSAAIPAPGTNGDVFAYRIEATDAAGWRATNGPHTFAVAIPALAVWPAGLTNILVIENTSTGRVLEVSNTGGGSLNWTAAVDRVGFRDDMELGGEGWSHSGVNDLWHRSTRRAFSGAQAWYAGSEATGEYTDGMDARLVCGPVTVRGNAALNFRYYADTEVKNATQTYDGGLVEISTNGGSSYQRIEPNGGYPYRIVGGSGSPFTNGTPCLAGTGGGWQSSSFSLAAWAGRDVLLAFRFGSDSSKVSEGWYVDDVAVTPDTGTNNWFAMAPSTGRLEAASTGTVGLTFDAAGLTGGTVRAATLRVSSDAPGSAPVAIPVSMIVLSRFGDLDGDGLTNFDELNFGADPFNPDSDGDTILDGPDAWPVGLYAWNDSAQFGYSNSIVTNSAPKLSAIHRHPAGGPAVGYALQVASDQDFNNIIWSDAGGTQAFRPWSRLWGSGGSDWGGPVTVSSGGEIYTALNAGGSLDGQPYAGQFDNALCKFNLHGQRLWTQMWGTPEMEFAKAIALDEARGCLYVSGETMGTLGGQTNAGHYDACLTRLSWQGSQEWVRLWGTVDEERTFGVGVDTAGCVYATGYTINPMDGQPFNGLIDCFLTKFSPEGDRLWTRLWGSTDADEPRGGLVVDTQGFVYVVGRTDGSFGSQTNNGGRDAFVTKFSPAGDQVWTRLLGSGSTEEGRGIAFGPQGHLYISGRTWGSFGGQTNQGGQDFFVVKLTTDGDEIWTRVLGSPYDDWGAQVAVDGEGNAYLLGGTKDPFYGHEPIGDYDPVACKIGPSGDLIWTHRWGSTNYENTAGIAADTWGNVYASGFTLGSFDGQTNSGYYDYEVFLTRLISEGGAQPIGPVADGARSPDIAYAGPPLTMGATHYWRIRFFDPSGQPSFWSEGANWFIYSDGDLDDDGLPDYWEQQHELDPFDDGGNNPDNGPEGDPDSDRFPNSGECIADTDPRSPASLFEVMRLVVGATNVLTFRASTQRLYTVSYSADLMTSNWLDLLVRWPATGEVVSVTDTNGAAHRIYRLGVERP